MTIRMVADYYYKLHEKREMTASEWLKVLNITMNNNIWRKSGTNKKNIIRAFKTLRFDTAIINGRNFDEKLEMIRKALHNKRPIIIYCVIRPIKEPYRHFAVVVGVNHNSIYINDPYPAKFKRNRPKRINLDTFKQSKPGVDQLVWGPVQWGIEVKKCNKKAS